MAGFKGRLLAWLLPAMVLAACSTAPVVPDIAYSTVARAHLYRLGQWSFEGRLSLTGNKDSWSAAIAWVHEPTEEQIRLSGPLGQGATVIRLTDGFVSIDRGNGDVLASDKPEAFIDQQLGVFVPLRALRYWVIGLPEPDQGYEENYSGFKQAGWLVDYRQTQSIGAQSMPRKITVMNEQAKLKLVIDEWVLDSANTR